MPDLPVYGMCPRWDPTVSMSMGPVDPVGFTQLGGTFTSPTKILCVEERLTHILSTKVLQMWGGFTEAPDDPLWSFAWGTGTHGTLTSLSRSSDRGRVLQGSHQPTEVLQLV